MFTIHRNGVARAPNLISDGIRFKVPSHIATSKVVSLLQADCSSEAYKSEPM